MKIPRKEIDYSIMHQDAIESVNLLTEEDSEAIIILQDLLRKDLNIFCLCILILDDMNIRGKQIAICFDYCKYNMDLFIKTLNEPYLANEMVNFLNGAAPIYGIYHKAVLFGAMELGRQFLEERKK